MENDKHADKIVSNMLENDPFSQWMGIEILEVRKGYCKIEMTVKKEMLNGFKITHGGIIFSLADSALAFASATFGKISLGIDHSISFVKKTEAGDRLIAEAECIHTGDKTGIIQVNITNLTNDLIATLKGTVYRTKKEISV